MIKSIVSVQDMRSGYGEAVVLRNFNLAIAPGEIVAVVGKNGMGKSTLLKSIMGYLPKLYGNVVIGDNDVTQWRPHRIARLGVGYVPQEKALFQDLMVEENVRLALPESVSWPAALAHIGRCFPVLTSRLKQRAGTLSGGEQKMLLTARVLASEAKLLLIDEITEGLQPSVIDHLAGVIRDERLRAGVAILLIEQNIPFTLAVADRYLVLDRGEIAHEGKTSEPDAIARITRYLSV